VKQYKEQEKEGLYKNMKATKSSLDPITLTEGDLDDIGDKVWGTTSELMQQFEQQQKKALSAIQTSLHAL